MANYCEDCGTKMWGNRCPNCHEESIILDQYFEQGMNPPPEDSEFMKKAQEQDRDVAEKESRRTP